MLRYFSAPRIGRIVGARGGGGDRGNVIALALLLDFLIVAPAASWAGEAAPPSAEALVDRAAAAPPKVTAARAAPAQIGTVPLVWLPPIDVAPLLAEDAARARGGERVLRCGVRRDLRVEIADGVWGALPGGARVWQVDIEAEGALGLRLGLEGLELPAGAQVQVFDPETAGLIWAYTGPGGPRAGRCWTPTVDGARARVQCLVPADVATTGWEPGFCIAGVQHVYRERFPGTVRGAGWCHNDVSCFPTWGGVARAVGMIEFVAGFGTATCSGQLLNCENNDFTPYFLTANHCIGTEEEAESATIYWFYQTTSCDGLLDTLRLSSECTLLSGSETSDYALLMVEGALPSNLTWAAWTAGVVAGGTDCATIHHPSGDYKRISFGPTLAAGGNFIRVRWTDGVTEPGSSGGGLFRQDTRQLIGQLCCGVSACGNPPELMDDDYGAFAVTYPQVASYLAGGSDDTLESGSTCGTAHDLSDGVYADLVVKSGNSDWYALDVPGGAELQVTAAFRSDHGDIDLALYAACAGEVLAESAGVTDTETLTFTNAGADAVLLLHVFLHSDTRNTYELSVSGAGGEPGTTPLAAPTGVSAGDGTRTDGVLISWHPVTGASHYQVRRGRSAQDSTELTGWFVGAMYFDGAAVAGTTYLYWVRAAADSSGSRASNWSNSEAGSRARVPLAAPTGVSASADSAAHIAVSWQPVADATHYRVYRAVGPDVAQAQPVAAWQTATSYVDQGVAPGESACYWVRAAADASGTLAGNFSAAACGRRILPDVAAPGDVTASTTLTMEIDVSWSPVDGATHYRVYRAASDDANAAAAMTQWLPPTAWADTGAAPATAYYYWVRAAASAQGERASTLSGPALGMRAEEVVEPPAPPDDERDSRPAGGSPCAAYPIVALLLVWPALRGRTR